MHHGPLLWKVYFNDIVQINHEAYAHVPSRSLVIPKNIQTQPDI